jgi:hypothetical protein
MAVTIKNEKKPRDGHCKALPRIDLNIPARLYVGHIMTYYDMCNSTVYANMRRLLLPQPDGKIGHRLYWKTSTIKADLNK